MLRIMDLILVGSFLLWEGPMMLGGTSVSHDSISTSDWINTFGGDVISWSLWNRQLTLQWSVNLGHL